MKNEIYVSIDVETNGPIPGDYSMLSFGAAAFDNTKLLSTYSANLEVLPNAKENIATMRWWSENQSAYDATRINVKDPNIAMKEFVEWAEKLNGKPVLIGYPVTFDFMFVHWYLIHFLDRSLFSFSALDIKTYGMAVMKTEYRESTKKNMPKRWFSDDKHTHIAVEDAIEQGKLFINMLKENTK
jgi:DNA polymerase III alpha subunit (gram-positive type)